MTKTNQRSVAIYWTGVVSGTSTALQQIPAQEPPLARPETLSIEVGWLADQAGGAVIRRPQRRFPGVVVQGAWLSMLVADAEAATGQFS
jgi:hypothetical protein